MADKKYFSFAGGELTPSLYARTDQIKYQTGARGLRNMYVPRAGGAFNRPGTEFTCELPPSEVARLIPFVFDDDNTYLIIFHGQRIFFVKDASLINDSTFGTKTIINITKGASTTLLLSTATGLSTAYMVYFESIGGMTELNGRHFLVSAVSGNTFQILHLDGSAVDSSGFGNYTSGGSVYSIYTLEHEYSADHLPDVQFAQSADVMFLTHIQYPIQKLSRLANASWTLEDFEIESDQLPITGVSGPSAGTNIEYKVYGVGSDGEIGDAYDLLTNTVATSGSPVTLTINTTITASYYNVLKNDGYIGATATNTFVDAAQTPEWYDALGNAPLDTIGNIESTTPKQAAAVGFYQQRLLFGNLYDLAAFEGDPGLYPYLFPETIACSFIGHYFDFRSRGPIADNDAYPFSFDVAGRRVNEIRHLVDLERLVVMTPDAVYLAQGDDAGALTPTTINLKRISSTGSAKLRPIVSNESLLYLEARRSIIRDLNFQVQTDGYKGNDLTIFAKHLFDGYTIVDWDYQLNPDSILFCARNDGVMLGMTYVKEQQIVAWHRHYFTAADSDGDCTEEEVEVENVCCIPEGDQDVLYICVTRRNAAYEEDTETGRTRRFIERFVIAAIDDAEDCKYLDSSLSFDGRNTNEDVTMTLSGGTDWDYTETLTLTNSAPLFESTDVGNEIHLTGSDGTIIRFSIEGYTDGNTETGKADKTVPATMRDVAIWDWAEAVDEVSGLWHLEGYKVSILADGYVIGSPNNSSYTEYTVTNGTITLPRPFAVIHVGLPYVSDLELLDIDTNEEGKTIVDRFKNIGKVNVYLEDSRGVFVGVNPNSDFSITGLTELKIREQEIYDAPNELFTGTAEVIIRPEWNSHGRVLLRQVDPLPMRINAVAVSGMIPAGG